ncbi:MAG TPA: Holliday junction resolvase RuvX [Vicinamibacterales bacterium]|nr:Holliday junction resolvase RuvX [Vicinamibacterales bacterium]
MRVLGVDAGARRLGLALSDDTASLARPWQTVPAGATPRQSAEVVAAMLEAARNAGDDEGGRVGEIVVGLPRRLNGEDTDQTAAARVMAAALHELTGLAVHLQDERLSSREAESRLALREKDWRKRKQKLDAASAAVILQDYLDRA